MDRLCLFIPYMNLSQYSSLKMLFKKTQKRSAPFSSVKLPAATDVFTSVFFRRNTFYILIDKVLAAGVA